MTRLFLTLVFALVASVAAAQDPIPDRRVAISRNLDFYGADLATIFDTTLDACQAACFADNSCVAFTYNQRNGSCFPKSGVSDVTAYDGAVSGRLLRTDPQVFSTMEARIESASFLSPRDFNAARDLGQTIGRLHSSDENTAQELLATVETSRRNDDLYTALLYTGAALALTDRADLWVDYSILARSASVSDTSERNRIRDRAVPAAINGYLRASGAAQQATALVALAEALEDDDRGRLMIDALRAAQEADFRRDTETLLEDAIGKYGFRVTDTDVESDSAEPRLCAIFNEPLVPAGVDYAPYVQLPDESLTVQASGEQLCVDGVVHGSRYRIVLREGLPAESGETLIRPIELTMYVRDRAPQVRFAGRGYVLPRTGEAALPVESVNVETVDLTLSTVTDRNIVRAMQEDLFARPLYAYDQDYFETYIGNEVWTGEADVQMELNADMTTRIPLAEAIADQPPGVYVLRASVPGQDPYDDPPATQWFVLSDLGIATMMGIDGLTVVVRSLADASATEGATITLISNANEVLETATTDATGVATFAPGLTRGTGAAAPALVTVEQGDDMAFLSLTGPAFDLSDRGVEGREPAPPVDVFLATDRGAYRAGETIHVTALMRDQTALAEVGLPLTAILTRPDGVEYSRHYSETDAAGGHVFALPVAGNAPRGVWEVGLYLDVDEAPLASDTVLVEDFLPERIDVALDLPETVSQTDTPPLKVQADYLFGAPAAGLDIVGDVIIRAASSVSEWPGYSFGRYDEPLSPRAVSLGSDWQTAEDGSALVDVKIPEIESGGRPMELLVNASVNELSGRPVERQATAQVLPDSAMIGIRPEFDGVVGEGTSAAFSLIGLASDLSAQPMDVSWTVNRVTTTYQWYRVNGRWNWEPVTRREEVASDTATLGEDSVEVSVPVDWGRYEIVVERTDGAYLASSQSFYAGWYAPADTGDTPDMLEASLDAESYLPGETAEFRIVPRYAGTALVTVMSNRVIRMEAVDVTEGENIIPLEVTEEWGAGAYVTASVIRPMDVSESRNPARALGLSYAQVDPGDKALSVSIEAPESATPRDTMEVGVQVDGIAEGEQAYVTLAAVDVGILNITGFESPDPQGHYFGQRKLGIEMRDIYGRLLDGMTGAMGQVRSGGDAGGVGAMQSPPPTEELVAYFTGPVEVGPDGRAEASFEIPAFNGTVRLMAIAWSGTGVGQADADVLIRDPVVVNVTVPRFLAPGDRSRMLIEVTHAYGPTGPVELDVTSAGLNLVAPDGFLDGSVQDQTGFVRSVPIVAEGAGVHDITLTVTGPDGDELVKTVTIPVQVNDPEVSRTHRFTLAAGESFTFDDQVFAGFVPASSSATLSVGPLARFDAPGLLAMLDRYPYGCTEQITSQALPLLYFDQVATAMGLEQAGEVGERIDDAITAVLANQSRNGAFGLWGPYSGDLWLDAYVTDFLSRAKARGHDVPDVAFEMAIDNLRNRVNYYPDFDSGGHDLAYALMVLAREGAAAIGDLRYYADEKAEDFTAPLAAAQLGAALAQYGEQRRADAMFSRAASLLNERLKSDTEASVWRADYGTDTRDAAAVLALAVEAGSGAVDRERLSEVIARPGRPSTQEATWTLLAANALIDDLRETGVTVDGAAPAGPIVHMREDAVNSAPVVFSNESDTDTELTLTTFGVPELAEPAGGNGYQIQREYFTMEGEAVDPTGITTGTRLVTVLTVRPFGRQEARLMVNDPLPAGFEIDNPNLLRGGDISALDWLDPVQGENAEFRQDRFLAAVDWRDDEVFRLAYIVRAVSPGEYHHPAASVEDMYRPQMRANTDTGRVTIVE
ncbi:alpha-2-macroglobulin family protein [Pelagovum pacificum]|uniref:Alpha-2-macroglobulin family protein n=1 Tax=Pelagovum pacificum TaxID=2588711 RepID=A0A5C5GJ59_9RHOB|nr:alpha-2-macroglobulin family protein [Pelagovum pacificum]QQA42938.1 alpha-2-macroglobulin family protein [Pelagovum pacificum]TNY33919.1 alpha-2-macroglobulin family protein [Pelagovum pacificum]